MTLNLEQALGDWYPIMRPHFNEEYMINIGRTVGLVADKLQPSPERIFRALQLTPPESVKVVILGQDYNKT